ncbi:MAG: PIG-L deacetylase family protein [Patescibacteria group bacterium]
MKILVIAAHPDDEILGCGGTIARLVKEGNEAYTLILGEGVTARDDKRDTNVRNDEINSLKEQMNKANEIIGVKEVITEDVPDNRFDSVDLLDIVKKIEKIKDRINPDVIFTHYCNDLNIDHKITAGAVLTATRPMVGETVKEIYSFEILSSTEWNYPLTFSPNTYFDISKTIDLKTEAMKQYKSEIRNYPHPRSVEGIELSANYWGVRTGLKCAEAFELIRCTK